MTEEEIEKQAEEYAKGKGHEHYNFLFEENSGSPIDFAKLCFQDGAKWGVANAIKWHDLRKDPKDLPKKCGRYWGYVDYYGLQHREILWEINQFDVTGVIAWCELPQFKG